MTYRLLADLLTLIHFGWILFMLYGFVLTVRGFWRPAFFDRWLFRTIHLTGILFVAALEILGRYCPLTIWENKLRLLYDPSGDYPGSFIIGWVERLVYPNVDPIILTVPTVAMALFVMVVFVIKPPSKFRFKSLG